MSRISAIKQFLLQSDPGPATRAKLTAQVFRNTRSIPSASTGLEQLYLCDSLFKIPRDLPGAVIELRCYRGSATATLSLACKLAGRNLIVCDSLKGYRKFTPTNQRSEIRGTRTRTLMHGVSMQDHSNR